MFHLNEMLILWFPGCKSSENIEFQSPVRRQRVFLATALKCKRAEVTCTCIWANINHLLNDIY